MNVGQGDVARPALDAADIGAGEAGLEGEGLRRELLHFAELPHARTEVLLDPRFLRLVHPIPSTGCGRWLARYGSRAELLWVSLVIGLIAPRRVLRRRPQRRFHEADIDAVEAVKLLAEQEQVGQGRGRLRFHSLLEQADGGFEDQQLRGRSHAGSCLAQLCGL